MSQVQQNELVEGYYILGLTFDEMACILAHKHGIIISTRHLKRITRRLKLYRRKKHSNILHVASFISHEITRSGKLHGYRWMHERCRQRGFVVSQKTVGILLRLLDPEGVKARTRGRLSRREYHNKGPNYLWHMDGYDKLKPYGICIHGCIDGFSRKIVWLEAYSTNNNPAVIAGYFMKAVRGLTGCPRSIRADFGTENTHVQQMQIFLRQNQEPDVDTRSVFLYGTSRCNQRIESWWSILRKKNAQFWMDHFKKLIADGQYSGDFIDQNLIRFCFLNTIQDELNEIVETWNHHTIRGNRERRSPNGRPYLLYHLPELCGTMDYLSEVQRTEEINICEHETMSKSEMPCDEDIFELCCLEMAENAWNAPNDPYEASQLYVSLRTSVRNQLNLQ